MIEFKCTQCGFHRKVSDKYAGKSVRCPECKTPNRVPKTVVKPDASASETYKFNCPDCNQKIRLKKKYAGRRLKCTKCGEVIHAPEINEPAPEIKLAAEPADVLRAGQDQQLDADAGGMNMDDLMQLEAQGPAVEIPGQSSVEQITQAPKPKGRSRQGGTGGKSKMPMIIGVVAIVVVALIGIGVMVGSSGGETKSKSESKKTADFGPLKEFSESYIYMLGDSKVDQAWELLGDGARDNTTKEQLQVVADMIDSKEIVTMDCYMTHLEGEPGQELYYMMYSVKYQDENEDDFMVNGRDVALVLQGDADNLRVADIGINDTSKFESVDLGLRSYEDLSMVVIGAKAEIVFDVFKKIGIPFFVGAFVFWLFMMIVMYMVFDKAGEPGWAIFVPFYGSWVYACVADQSGWLGLSTCFIGYIPVIGPLAVMGIWWYLTFNIGKARGRGVGFSLGLCFLPFIFFPILAFTD